MASKKPEINCEVTVSTEPNSTNSAQRTRQGVAILLCLTSPHHGRAYACPLCRIQHAFGDEEYFSMPEDAFMAGLWLFISASYSFQTPAD